MILTSLIFVLFFQSVTIDSNAVEDNGLRCGVLFHVTGSADIRQGLKTLQADSLTAFPTVSFTSEWARFSAVAAVDYAEKDSTSLFFDPVSAAAFFRWPGSPWAAAGISVGEIEPFVFGLSSPVNEWNSRSASDSLAVTVEAGGVLGFDGFWSQFGDSLSWYGIESPWLGFGTVKWNRITQNSNELDAVQGFLDLRYVKPWFLFEKQDSTWQYAAEIRGWKPLRNREFSVEVVPMLSIEEDSTKAGLTGYLRGVNRAMGGSLQILYDVENSNESLLSAGLDVLSQAGIAWCLDAYVDNFEDFHGTVSGFYRKAPAGCGAAFEMFNSDSITVAATALYSPAPGVSTELTIVSDLSTDSPDPGCVFRVFGCRDDFVATIEVEWEEGLTTLGLEVSAWLD